MKSIFNILALVAVAQAQDAGAPAELGGALAEKPAEPAAEPVKAATNKEVAEDGKQNSGFFEFNNAALYQNNWEQYRADREA